MTYLYHKITDKGILPDNIKYDVIRNYLVPENTDAIKRFLAFCNYYRRFVPNFAKIAYPPNQLTKTNSKFIWSQECQNSFENLKVKLNPPILQYPDYSKQFVLITDASKQACNAILAQKFDCQELRIAYVSRTFTQGE